MESLLKDGVVALYLTFRRKMPVNYNVYVAKTKEVIFVFTRSVRGGAGLEISARQLDLCMSF